MVNIDRVFGEITCHKCKEKIDDGDLVVIYVDKIIAIFHRYCFSRYQHYYGLDKPID